MTLSLEGWPTKAKEAPSPNEVRLVPLDTNPVFQCLRERNTVISLVADKLPQIHMNNQAVGGWGEGGNFVGGGGGGGGAHVILK